MSIDKDKLNRIDEIHKALKEDFDKYSAELKKNIKKSIGGNDILLSEKNFSEHSPKEEPEHYSSFQESGIRNVLYHNSAKPSVSFTEDTRINSRIGQTNNINLGDSVRIRESENKYTTKNAPKTQKKDEQINSVDSIKVQIGDKKSVETYNTRTLAYNGTYTHATGDTKFTKSETGTSLSSSAILSSNTYSKYNKINFSITASISNFGIRTGLVLYEVRAPRTWNLTLLLSASNHLHSSRIINFIVIGTTRNSFGKAFVAGLYKRGNFYAWVQHKFYGKKNCMSRRDDSVTYCERSRVSTTINMNAISRALLARKNAMTTVL